MSAAGDSKERNGADENPAPEPAFEPVPLIPDHELLRRIDRGSYGEVWLARNMMGTFRAVKIVYRKSFEHQRAFERELTGLKNFEPRSRSHEGFIDVLQVGRDGQDRFFYYVMELGDDRDSGQAITPDSYRPKNLASEVAQKGRLDLSECLKLGLSLSNALSYLHEQGLSHRDIKPSNIVFVQGIPKLADIGLVTVIGQGQSYVGTEGFIPPEGPGTPQADIYSLGKVLYEISTGNDRHDFPSLPANFTEFPDLEGFREFNEVVIRACQRDLDKRYQSAREMHAELTLLLHGESVRRLHLLEHRWQVFKRVGTIIGISLTIIVFLAYLVFREAKQAAESRQRKTGSFVAYGSSALAEGNLLGAYAWFVEALQLNQGDPVRVNSHRLRCNTVLSQCPKLVQMWFESGPIKCADFSPNGQHIAIGKWFSQAQVWDVITGKAISPKLGSKHGVRTIFFSPEGTSIITASEDLEAVVWDVAKGEMIHSLLHPDRVYGARFSPDGKRIVTACEDKQARVWDSSTGKLLSEVGPHEDAVIFAAFSHDGRWIVTTSKDNTARIWDAATGRSVGLPLKHASWVYSAGFDPDGGQVVTASADRTAQLWDAASGRKTLPPLTHNDAVLSASFSPDGGLIVTGSADFTVRIWDAPTHQPVKVNSVLKHNSRVLFTGFAPDGHRLVTACADGTTRVWDLAANTMLPRVTTNQCSLAGSRFLMVTNRQAHLWSGFSQKNDEVTLGSQVQQAKFDPQGDCLLTTSRPDKTGPKLQVWDLIGKPLSPPLAFTHSLDNVRLSKDGRRLAAFQGQTAWIFDVRTGKSVSPILAHTQSVTSVLFSPDGQALATTTTNNVHLWNVTNGKEIFPPLRLLPHVTHVEFSPDGRKLATCFADEQWTECWAQVWSTTTGWPIGSPLKHRDGVLYASFSPDGQRVVTASEDFTAMVWDADTGRPLAGPLRHEDQVQEALFSQDGRWIITSSWDKTVRLWDAETGEPLTPPLRHATAVWEARFAADARHLIAEQRAGRVSIWDLPDANRPINDLVILSQLLSGYEPPGSEGTANTARHAALRSTWEMLKATHPSDFTVSREEILFWHQRQAESNEQNRQWRAALFHLNRLLALEPGDQTIAQRIVQAELAMTREKPSKWNTEILVPGN